MRLNETKIKDILYFYESWHVKYDGHSYVSFSSNFFPIRHRQFWIPDIKQKGDIETFKVVFSIMLQVLKIT